MPTITLPTATIEYRVTGPADAATPPVVFVHGFLVDGTLWSGVADRLAAAGTQCFVPDWPLGSHRTPARTDAELSPGAVADLVLAFLAALDLTNVTLVGNDTGGAICQLVLARDSQRIGRVVFTNCDVLENFPPKLFVPVFLAARHRALLWTLLQPMRLTAIRHSPVAFGPLLRKPRDGQLTRGWLAGALGDVRIRRDIVRFARGLDRGALVAIAPQLRSFAKPVRLVWGMRDRWFSPASGHRLAALFDDATFVEVPDATTFVSVDRPDAVAAAIVDLHRPVDAPA